jgi:hypothetical protein
MTFFFGGKVAYVRYGSFATDPISISAGLCPLRPESDRSAAMRRMSRRANRGLCVGESAGRTAQSAQHHH